MAFGLFHHTVRLLRPMLLTVTFSYFWTEARTLHGASLDFLGFSVRNLREGLEFFRSKPSPAHNLPTCTGKVFFFLLGCGRSPHYLHTEHPTVTYLDSTSLGSSAGDLRGRARPDIE